jgi:hypothetical protein
VVFLVVTPAYGVLLAVNLKTGFLGADRFVLVARHVHVALVGIVLLVAVGVAHRLLPMFLLSHGTDERAGWLSIGLLFSGATLLAVPIGGGGVLALAGALVGAGVLAFLAQAAAFFRHSLRPSLDPGLRLAAAGLLGLLAAVLVAPFALSRGVSDPRLLATYLVVLVGALSLFVAGHYYKIVPFLVWFHRFGPLVGRRPVPKVGDLFSRKIALVNAALLVLGWLGLVAGTFLGAVALLRSAALVFAAGALLEVVVIARVTQRRPA